MTAAPTRRINRGRGHSYVLDGQPCDGVTTILSKALPKPALVGWAARSVAQLVCDRREILQQLSDEEIMDLLKGAPYRDRDAAANRGTEVHNIAEKLARNEKVDVPEHIVGHVDAFLAWDHAFNPTWLYSEATVINRRYRMMGTLDAIVDMPSFGRVLLDVKTNRSGPFGEVALQLAGYRNAEVILKPDGTEVPMPEVDLSAVLWLTADGYELIPFEVGESEWRTLLYLQQVARWIDTRERNVKGYAVSPPPVQAKAS